MGAELALPLGGSWGSWGPREARLGLRACVATAGTLLWPLNVSVMFCESWEADAGPGSPQRKPRDGSWAQVSALPVSPQGPRNLQEEDLGSAGEGQVILALDSLGVPRK